MMPVMLVRLLGTVVWFPVVAPQPMTTPSARMAKFAPPAAAIETTLVTFGGTVFLLPSLLPHAKTVPLLVSAMLPLPQAEMAATFVAAGGTLVCPTRSEERR